MKYIRDIFIFSLGIFIAFSILDSLDSFIDFGDDWKNFLDWEFKDQYLNVEGLFFISFKLIILSAITWYFTLTTYYLLQSSFTHKKLGNHKPYKPIASKGASKGERLELPNDVDEALSRIEQHIDYYGSVTRYGLVRPLPPSSAEEARKDIVLIRAALAAKIKMCQK